VGQFYFGDLQRRWVNIQSALTALALKTRRAELLEELPVSLDRFIASSRFNPDDRDFHFSLLPSPYVGNLSRADILLLLLNPGFKPADPPSNGEGAALTGRRIANQTSSYGSRDDTRRLRAGFAAGCRRDPGHTRRRAPAALGERLPSSLEPASHPASVAPRRSWL